MGFFSGVLGGGGGDSSRDQKQKTREDRQFLESQLGGARASINPLFDISNQQQALSSQQALDVLRGALPSQLSAFQQGNVGAQQALLGGDFTPQALNFDTSFLPQQLAQLSPDQINQIQRSGAQKSLVSDLDRQILSSQSALDRALAAGGKSNRKLAKAQRGQLEAFGNQRERILGGQF